MAEYIRRKGRFYCPGCDEYIGGEYGPLVGSYFCDGCVAAGKDKPQKHRKKKAE